MMTIKKPDLTAPRFRPSRYNVLSEEMVSRFKKKFPQYKGLSYSQAREILGTYNKLLWEEAISFRDGAEFPEALGYIFIGSCPTAKKFNLDVQSSLKLGQRVRHRNFESDNYLAKIFYTNYASKYRFQNRQMWMFKGCREFTRAVNKTYPEKWPQYRKVDNLAHVSKMFKEKMKNQFIEDLRKDLNIPDDYNEFDID